MVGVPLKSRCDTCRKRKKKCGGQRPQCAECRQAGWLCPGYQVHWKFVDENSALSKHYAGRTYVYDVIDSELVKTSLSTINESTSSFEVLLSFGEVSPSPEDWSVLALFREPSVLRSLDSNSLGSALVYCLKSQDCGALIPLALLGSFFDFIPSRLGCNEALESGVICLCSIYLKASSAPYSSNKIIYGNYVRALRSLRAFVEDESPRYDSETLCASILLQLSELLVSSDRKDWSRLATGTANLISIRGVDRYKSAFEYAMLDSQLGFLVALSLKSNETSFLCLPEWQRLFQETPLWGFEKSQPPSLRTRSRLSKMLVHVPDLISQAKALVNQNFLVSSREFVVLIDILWAKIDHLETFVETEINAISMLRENDLKGCGLQPRFTDIIAGVCDCVAHMGLLSLDNALRSLYLAGTRGSLSLELGEERAGGVGRPLHDLEIIDRWRMRVMRAFQYVKCESPFAAQPLKYGMHNFRSLIFDQNYCPLVTLVPK